MIKLVGVMEYKRTIKVILYLLTEIKLDFKATFEILLWSRPFSQVYGSF